MGASGVVGCSFEALVISRVSRAGVNSATGVVLAKVEGMNGEVQRVSLVELSAARNTEGPLHVERVYEAPHIRLEITNHVNQGEQRAPNKPLEPTR